MKIKITSIIACLIIIFSSSTAFATYGVQTKTSHCISSILPDSACSPGAVLTTNTKVICVSGYTKTVRNVSTATKKKVFKEYDISYTQHSNYEVDHIISLELGGSNDTSNLYPESYLIKDNARVKDKFENYLHKEVCNGTIAIDEAQKEISSDWLTYYQQRVLGVKNSILNTPSVSSIIKSTSSSPSIKSSTVSTEPAVKKSSTGICHAIGTTYYSRTTKYTAYNSIADCIASGGRLPAR
jgi:hypothetical protein